MTSRDAETLEGDHFTATCPNCLAADQHFIQYPLFGALVRCPRCGKQFIVRVRVVVCGFQIQDDKQEFEDA